MQNFSNCFVKKKKLFVAFPWVETSTGPGGFMICVFINMTGTPEGSTESGFMEKPGIEPATPGLQGIALIHYTTGASQQLFCMGELDHPHQISSYTFVMKIQVWII